MRLVDSHSHLEEIEDLDAAIEKAKSVGVIAIVAVGSDYLSNNQTLEIAAKYSGFVFPALGIHPSRIASTKVDQTLQFIEDHLAEASAIGEVGLDYHKRVIASASKERQKAVLTDILAIAKKHHKPVIIHNRYAWQDSFTLVEKAGVEKAVFHWYTGPTSTLKDIVSKGYAISATPAAEYHSEHRRAVKAASLENLLIETDSPVDYGTEQRWKAEPADVVRTLKAVSAVRGISEQELSQTTTNNAIVFFGLPFKD